MTTTNTVVEAPVKTDSMMGRCMNVWAGIQFPKAIVEKLVALKDQLVSDKPNPKTISELTVAIYLAMRISKLSSKFATRFAETFQLANKDKELFGVYKYTFGKKGAPEFYDRCAHHNKGFWPGYHDEFRAMAVLEQLNVEALVCLYGVMGQQVVMDQETMIQYTISNGDSRPVNYALAQLIKGMKPAELTAATVEPVVAKAEPKAASKKKAAPKKASKKNSSK